MFAIGLNINSILFESDINGLIGFFWEQPFNNSIRERIMWSSGNSVPI